MAEAYPTARSMAAALGVSPAAFSGYLRRDDWPAGIPKRPPWTDAHLARLGAWRAWLQEDRSGKAREESLVPGFKSLETRDSKPETPPTAAAADTYSPSARQRADVMLKLQRVRKIRAEADLAEGKVVERELLDLALIAVTRLFVQSGDDTFERLPHQLAGAPGDFAAIDAACRQAWAELRERVLNQAEVELARVDDEVHDRLTRKRRPRGRRSA